MSKNNTLHDEIHFKVLRLLEANPNLNQRKLAEALGISLGKTNFCLQALINKGLLKIENFRSNQNKLSYAYLLTPQMALLKKPPSPPVFCSANSKNLMPSRQSLNR